jgi:predicted glycoside hydrolase/deacetylase ChbG (UPF0249 family)
MDTAGQRRLIINADDLGYDPSISRGILEAIRLGVVSSATLIVNSPYSLEAADQARDLRVGLHLNLARYAPCWRQFPASWLDHGNFSESRAGQLPPEVVENETLAQLDRFESWLKRPATHLDVHKHLHLHLGILDGLCAAANKRGLPVRSISGPMRSALRQRGVKTTDHFIGDAGVEPYWTMASFGTALKELRPGITELMCHPGYTPTAIETGYARQREVELATFTNPGSRRLLESYQVTLTSFQALSPSAS